jgi:hypothetical protein
MQVLFLLFLLLSQSSISQTKTDTTKFFSTFIIGKIGSGQELNLGLFEMMDYKFATDILTLKFGAFSNELGENGKPVNLNFNFMDMRGCQFFLNGRTLNGYIYPYQFLNMVPVDNVYLIELIDDFKASMFQNANSSVVNFSFKNIFTPRPITRIRYVEDAYDLIVTDGSFTHNFRRDLNFTVGFRRGTSAGRFLNSQYDSWNIFGNVFWTPLKNMSLSLLNIYTTTKTALNGGIYVQNPSNIGDETLYNERLAPVVDSVANLAIERNDLTLVLNYIIDSLLNTSLTAYHTFQTDEFSSKGVSRERNSSLYGLKLNFSKRVRLFNLNAGLEVQRNGLIIPSSGFRKKIFLFSSSLEVEGNFQSLKPSLFVKVDDVNGQFLVNYGAGFGNNFKSFKFMGGFSLSYRVPTLIEQSVTGLSEAERHRIYEVSAEYETKGVILSFKVQNRSISNGIIFHDSTFYIANLRRTFLQFNSTFKIWKFGIDLKQSVSLNKVTKPYPRYFLTGEIFFEGKLTRTLELKAGARLKSSTEFWGYKFINRDFIFAESDIKLKRFAVLDLFLSGRVKSAVLFLTLANVTNVRYMTASFYPMQDRSLRFGVVWNFFD